MRQMSNPKKYQLIWRLQMATGSSYYALENLTEVYSKRFPQNSRVIELLKLIVFSTSPNKDQMADEVIGLIYR